LAFEIHPETLVVMLSVRIKRALSVTIALSKGGRQDEQAIDGDCVILYSQNYDIKIASYLFTLIWRPTEGPDQIQALKNIAVKSYEHSMQQLKNVRSRDLLIPETSTAKSRYITRLQSSKAPLFTEVEGSRVLIGQGAFGKVCRAIDQTSGNYFAVKEVDLSAQTTVDPEKARAALHREIKIIETTSHVSLPL
jgi:hypothetical protein